MPDYAAMSDLEIKQYKTKLHWLRQDASPNQDRGLKAEMQRAQAVINDRQRARALDSIALAKRTPGAVSTTIQGVSATGGAVARESGA